MYIHILQYIKNKTFVSDKQQYIIYMFTHIVHIHKNKTFVGKQLKIMSHLFIQSQVKTMSNKWAQNFINLQS